MVWLAELGSLQPLPLLPCALALALSPGNHTLHSGEQSTVICAQVGITRDGSERESVPVGQFYEVLELNWSAVESIQIPGDYGVKLPGFDVGEHALIVGPDLAGESGNVIVNVFDGVPAALLAEFQAVFALPSNREPGPVVVF
jgi:hypothetical protein